MSISRKALTIAALEMVGGGTVTEIELRDDDGAGEDESGESESDDD